MQFIHLICISIKTLSIFTMDSWGRPLFLLCFLVGETHHLLVGQLPPLNAAAVPHCLLVPLPLNVTEQVDLRGDLQHKHRGQRFANYKAMGLKNTNLPHNAFRHHSRPDSSQVSRHMFQPFKAKYDPLILTDICRAARHLS